MSEVTYRVGDLKKLIRESSNEFKPVLGANVKSDNKKNNEKSYKDSEKKAKEYDGGLREPEKKSLTDKCDGNRTTIDYNPITDPDDAYKKRVNAQMKGYTSDMEMNNGIEKVGDFDNEGRISKYLTKDRDEHDKDKKTVEKSGLTAREYPDKNFDKKHLNEDKRVKKLIFKNTRFVNESHMLSRIPEEYKRNGQKIYMKDKDDNEYIVECVQNNFKDCIETNVISFKNERKMNEEVIRMKELFSYDSSEYFGSPNGRYNINEEKAFKRNLETSRNM